MKANRPLIRFSIGAALALLALPAFAQTPPPDVAPDRPYLDAALAAERWIRSARVEQPIGVAWKVAPDDADAVQPWLYSGSAGVVLFYLELHAATNNQTFLNEAIAGANYLMSQVPDGPFPDAPAGLYTGLAGIGFALTEVYKSADNIQIRLGANRVNRHLIRNALHTGRGVEWSASPDIIGGGAGVGLYLLHAAREMNDPALRETARLAGLRLIELGRPAEGGLMWTISAGSERNMPNFSHGTAGVAYFLAKLHRETEEREFLDAALKGAAYLRAVADSGEGGATLVFHDDPGGRDRHYLGWCHGPAGTAQLFHQLHRATGDEAWMDWTRRSALGAMNSGIPEARPAGFWNNAGMCCGNAGVARFFADLYKVTQDAEYLEFARRMTADLLRRATKEGDGLKWIQAEHRVRPEFLQAQTGLMQGAAGIGLALLHLDATERDRPARITLPDSPFRSASREPRRP